MPTGITPETPPKKKRRPFFHYVLAAIPFAIYWYSNRSDRERAIELTRQYAVSADPAEISELLQRLRCTTEDVRTIYGILGRYVDAQGRVSLEDFSAVVVSHLRSKAKPWELFCLYRTVPASGVRRIHYADAITGLALMIEDALPVVSLTDTAAVSKDSHSSPVSEPPSVAAKPELQGQPAAEAQPQPSTPPVATPVEAPKVRYDYTRKLDLPWHLCDGDGDGYVAGVIHCRCHVHLK